MKCEKSWKRTVATARAMRAMVPGSTDRSEAEQEFRRTMRLSVEELRAEISDEAEAVAAAVAAELGRGESGTIVGRDGIRRGPFAYSKSRADAERDLMGVRNPQLRALYELEDVVLHPATTREPWRAGVLILWRRNNSTVRGRLDAGGDRPWLFIRARGFQDPSVPEAGARLYARDAEGEVWQPTINELDVHGSCGWVRHRTRDAAVAHASAIALQYGEFGCRVRAETSVPVLK